MLRVRVLARSGGAVRVAPARVRSLVRTSLAEGHRLFLVVDFW